MVNLGSRLSDYAAGGRGIGAALLLGAATGLLWTPCAGPVLGLVLTGAAIGGPSVETALCLAAYAIGAATSMAATMFASARLFAALRRSIGLGARLRQALGMAVLAGVTAIALGLDTGLLARVSYAHTAEIEQSILDHVSAAQSADAAADVIAGAPAPGASLPVLGMMPQLDGAEGWLNTQPLGAASLRGKAVLVDFWTYSCINCIRTLPYIRAWAERYGPQGLVVIGVHTPEFAFERDIANVQRAVRRFGITFPVAIDSDFSIWRAFQNRYWPALYFVDAQGRIRHHQFGEGGYERSEQVIQALLAEAGGAEGYGRSLTSSVGVGAEAPPDLANLRSEETYLGYLKAARFASPEGLAVGQARDYTAGHPWLGAWSLRGDWTVEADRSRLNRSEGAIVHRFRARDLHLVMGPARRESPIRFQVTIDGRAPGPDHGADIDAMGNGTASEVRLYQLVRQSGEVRERTFEIRFFSPGVEAFAFTFG